MADHSTWTGNAIEGWVDRVSVLPGQAVRLYVSTIDRHWQVTAYRMGWYGGALAHRVWQSGSEPGVRQRKPTRSAATNTVRTAWRPSLDLRRPIGCRARTCCGWTGEPGSGTCPSLSDHRKPPDAPSSSCRHRAERGPDRHVARPLQQVVLGRSLVIFASMNG